MSQVLLRIEKKEKKNLSSFFRLRIKQRKKIRQFNQTIGRDEGKNIK